MIKELKIHCMIQKCCLALIFLLSITAFGQQRKLKTIKKQEDKNSIRYKWHTGKALLKTGLPLVGKFKFVEEKNEVPTIKFVSSELPEKRTIDLPMFERLVLRGAERNITNRSDSTVFEWVEEFDNLMRVVKKGAISVYDNSKIISEKYKYLTQYLMIGKREDSEVIVAIEKVSDLEDLMKDRPYFLEAAKATGNLKKRDLRVIIYLIERFNKSPKEMDFNWPQGEVVLKNGDKLRGQFYIQPMDLRNEHNTNEMAWVHLHDGSDYRLLRHDEINQLRIDGKLYRNGYYSIADKHFYGRKWMRGGKEYLVARKITNRNSFYFYSKYNNEQDIVIFENLSGTHRRPTNETELRIEYIRENPLR